jgi:anti-sigma factor RsiW
MGDDEIGRLHAELERLAAEVAQLRERLDDRDMEQAARDDALNRAMSGGRRPWSPRLLDGAAGAKAALVALTVAKGAATICEGLKSLPRARRAEARCTGRTGDVQSSTETRRFG